MNRNPKPISDAELVGMMQRNQKSLREQIEQLESENAKLRAELERRAVDGWKWVPVEPTPEIIRAMQAEMTEAAGFLTGFTFAYRAALAAAPSAPATVQGVNQQLIKALEAVLNSGRGTSGRIILDAQDEADVRAAIAEARQEGGKV